MSKVKIHWASGVKEPLGNSYGYWVHNEMLKKYVSKIAEITTDTNNTLFLVSPEYYKNHSGKKDFLFTMFEGTTIPKKYKDSMEKADYFIAPSTFVKDIFDEHFPDKETCVCNHGIEKDFTYIKRKFPHKKKFRFLWVGAHNPRKGWEEIINIWQRAGFHKNTKLELYLKTTRIEGIQKKENVILDGRKLSKKDLIKLYHSAHCFVFPTRGEGFGLTLAEAMATGLPCIATNYSGHLDFFNSDVGYPVGFKMGKTTVTYVGDSKEEETMTAYPDVTELALKMIEVVSDYKTALSKGKKASLQIKRNFTWEKSAKTLVNFIKSKECI